MTDRIWLKTLSILLGVFAWIYVNLVIPPQIRRTIEAEVEYRNVPESVKVTPVKPSVNVQVEGTRRDFILATNNKLQVTVDLYNLRPGRAQLPVRVTTAPGLSVVSLSPAQIQIEAVPIIRKKIDVRAEILGQPADGFLFDEPLLTPAQVTIEGPDSLIKRVTACQVDINLEQVKNSISEQREIKVILESGVTDEEIIVTPGKINVDVTVKQGYPAKTLPLAKPVFINKSPEGKKLDGFKLVPESVQITGPARLINPMKDLSFKPIDLSKIEKSDAVPVKLEFPGKKVRLISSEPVLLHLTLVDSKVTRVYQGLPFELKKGPHQHASVSVSSYSIEVEGYLKDLDKISNAKLEMILDVEKMKPGSYPVNLTAPVGLPGNITVLKIVPEALQVLVSELEDQPDPPKNASDSAPR